MCGNHYMTWRHENYGDPCTFTSCAQRAYAKQLCRAHYNQQRADNRIENLELWTSPQPAGVRVGDYTTMTTTRGTVIVARI